MSAEINPGPQQQVQDFHIVGVGASDDGWKAFKKLLQSIPENSGMAYVLDQHLSPTLKNSLSEIVARESTLPIREIPNDMNLEPNHVYLIPENKTLTSIDGVLKVSEKNHKIANLERIAELEAELERLRDGMAIDDTSKTEMLSNQTSFTELLEKQVSERTQELNESQSFLQAVLSSTHYGIASYEPIKDADNTIIDFKITFSNEEVPKNFGLKTVDVIGKTCKEMYPGIFDNGIFEKLVECMESGDCQDYQISIEREGGEMWLDAVIEKVNNSVTVTSKNITAEKIAARHLEEINIELERKNKELESFNYIASHDLQEPLRKIMLFYSRILDKDKNNLSEDSIGYFSSIKNAAERMQHLIQALLSYSTANYTDMSFEKTDLNKLLGEVNSDLEDMIVAKNAVIESELLPKISVIPFQFRQLLANLISNGIKYSKKDVAPIIRITTELSNEGEFGGRKFLKIHISDNGIGFEQQYEDKIFELFQRLHGKNEFVGTGIGLAICKKIIDNHKGFIKVRSEPDKGSVFTIGLPFKI